MATVEKYRTSSGAALYAVRYRTPERGQTMKRGFRTKKLADAYPNSVEVKVMAAEYIKPSLERITVGEPSHDWLSRKKEATAPSHYRMLESAYRVHVGPRWGGVSVADIDLPAVEAWITGMVAKGAGATTVLRRSDELLRSAPSLDNFPRPNTG